MERLPQMLEQFNTFLWSYPVLGMILGIGIYLTVRGRAPQLRLLPRAVRSFLSRLTGEDGSSSMRALCIALAATVGTGNIAGVAYAISVGGPGAVFWIWVSGFLGMAIKLCESTLAVHLRCRSGADGEILAGPMYMIREGLPGRWHFLGTVYCFFGIFAAFGVGNATQIHAVFAALSSCTEQYGVEISEGLRWGIGLTIAAAIFVLVSGGIRKIGAGAEFLVPAACAGYTLLCVTAVVLHRSRLLPALHEIIYGAFSPQAVTGGAVTSAFMTLRIGISRGIFTNEAGMGTAAMAHGTAEVSHPVEQGLMGIMEVFLDTIVICTLTAVLILTSGVDIPYGSICGAELTARALASSFGPWAGAFLCACLSLFALATVLGWGLYAGRCIEYLLGKMNWRLFACGQAACAVVSIWLQTGTVWVLSDIMNGLMAIPNLVALMLLSPVFFRLVRSYRWNLSLENSSQVCYNRKKSIETYESVR